MIFVGRGPVLPPSGVSAATWNESPAFGAKLGCPWVANAAKPPRLGGAIEAGHAHAPSRAYFTRRIVTSEGAPIEPGEV